MTAYFENTSKVPRLLTFFPEFAFFSTAKPAESRTKNPCTVLAEKNINRAGGGDYFDSRETLGTSSLWTLDDSFFFSFDGLSALDLNN